jgi:signal transduction histidine kinase
MTSLRTRLLIAVGALAVAVVSAVAIAVRHETRQEFLRFEDREHRTASAHVAEQARAVAHLLDGQCCDASLRSAAARARLGLAPDQVLLIVDRDRGTLVAATGAPLDTTPAPAVATHYERSDVDSRGAGSGRSAGTGQSDSPGRPGRSDGGAQRDGIGPRDSDSGGRAGRDNNDGRVLIIELTRQVNGLVSQMQLRILQQDAPIHLSDGRAALVCVVAMPSADREGSAAQFLGSLDRRVLFVTMLIALCALLATWMIARGVTGPLRDLQSATHALAHGDLARRIVLRRTGSREVRELSGAFNQMADALERQATLRQDLIRDVAHELRTPLTAVRCRIDAVLDGLSPDPDAALNSLLDEVRHLERLVDDLQDTALAEAGELRLTIENLPLLDVVQSALRTAHLESDPRVRVQVPAAHRNSRWPPGARSPAAEENPHASVVTSDISGVAPLRVHGDAVRVRQILLNLLTNASRYTPPGGTITVRGALIEIPTEEPHRFGIDADRDHVVVEVHNSGSQLSPDELARVFDRFYRTDPSRVRASGGSGLGLAIVKHLVEAQHGRAWATSDDTGVTVGFTLPAAAADAQSATSPRMAGHEIV